jgi:hypothetical protein
LIVPGIKLLFQFVAQVVRHLVFNMAIRCQVEVNLIGRCRRLPFAGIGGFGLERTADSSSQT